MQISGETNDLDLYSDCLWLCGLDPADVTSYPLKDFVRNANFGLNKVTAKVIKAKNWQHNDFNNSTELIDRSTNIVSGTNKYAILITWLRIGAPVRVKDSAGNWHTIHHKERVKLTDAELVATGIPTTYEKRGNYIYLAPNPNFTISAALEVPYQTGATEFAYNATTTIPGFPILFHRLISLYPALDYCMVNIPDRVAGIQAQIDKMETDLVLHYETRDDDEQPNLSIERDDYGQSALM